jgi:hypothetical protein
VYYVVLLVYPFFFAGMVYVYPCLTVPVLHVPEAFPFRSSGRVAAAAAILCRPSVMMHADAD